MDKLMDLHNHTHWSDGGHTPEAIIENAMKNGITTVGISDHFHTIKCNSIPLSALELYMDKINQLKVQYKDSIEVLCGVEICMNREWSDLDKLPYELLNKLDYVLLEYVDMYPQSVTLKEVHQYTEKLTVRKGLAHTHLLILSEMLGMDNIISHLKKNNLFWEINVNEGYEYFDEILMRQDDAEIKDLFDKLKDNNIEITVGSDTHYLKYYDVRRIKIGNDLINGETNIKFH